MSTKRTNEEWVDLYKQQRTSGLTMKDWCSENGIKLPTMADRVSRLRKEGLIESQRPTRGKNSTGSTKEKSAPAKNTKSKWLEVLSTKTEFCTDSSDIEKTKYICIEVGRFKINVPDDFCEESFCRICKALVSIC